MYKRHAPAFDLSANQWSHRKITRFIMKSYCKRTARHIYMIVGGNLLSNRNEILNNYFCSSFIDVSYS